MIDTSRDAQKTETRYSAISHIRSIRGRIEARETNQDIREALRATSATEFINATQEVTQ